MMPPLVLLAVAGATVGSMAASGAFSGGGGMKSVAASGGMAKKTATPEAGGTAQEALNKRMAAATLTKDWDKMPVLGKKSLLGL